MAFVYRSEKKSVYLTSAPNPEVGPGSYEPDVKPHIETITGKKAPFVSSVERDKQFTQETPGPGAYNIEAPMDGHRVIFQSAENEIKILEVPKPISVFKSGTDRFKDNKVAQSPGPGSYDPTEPQYRQIPQKNQVVRTGIIQKLMQANKYQSIPSIPGAVHSFGYTENEYNDLKLNPNPIIKYSGTKRDMVGPGSYDIAGSFDGKRKRCLSWKQQQSRTTNSSFSSVGPGSYDPTESVPMHSYKPSVAFTSKTLRTFDQRRGIAFGSHLRDRFKKQSDSFQQGDEDTEEESEYEFIEDATPGPGSYQGASTASTIQSSLKSESHYPFGSVGERFKEVGIHKPSAVGPGQYNLQAKTVKIQPHVQNIKPPFLSSDIRFDPKPINNVPGPTYYNPKNSMEEKLINVLQKAPLGSFGVNEQRFKDNHMAAQIPGPGTYEQVRGRQPGKQKLSSSFQSQTLRSSLARKSNSPPPGAYDQVNNTIAQACKIEEEDDPELAIQKPPFGVGEKRWKEPKQIPEEEEEDEPIQRSINDLFKKKSRNLPPFNTRTRRFNYSVGNDPGPGEYHEGLQPAWNKRTFNIIFAEI